MNLIGTLQTTEFAGTRTRLIQFLTWWTRELGRIHSNFAASRTSSGAMFFRREGQTSLCVHEKDGWTERATLTDHAKDSHGLLAKLHHVRVERRNTFGIQDPRGIWLRRPCPRD